MPKHRILISYTTGDSSHSEDRSDYVDVEWTDITIAKENLERIKQHYEQYQAINSYGIVTKKIEDIFTENMDKPWFVYEKKPFSTKTDRYYAENCIKLKLDNGNEFQMNCFWCGYFESLHSAEIKVDESDMKIEF